MTTPAHTIRLENWVVTYPMPFDPYQAPEARPRCLHGTAYNHPRFPNGKSVTTTPITHASQGLIHTQSGSVYRLGTPKPAYEAQHPNARQRTLETYNAQQTL